MSAASELIRQKIVLRANNRCEYCLSHQNYIMEHLQVDHIIPVVKDGLTTEDNLCLACELCNQYKWTRTDGVDPQSGKCVSLFNPRKQKWDEHFTWNSEGVEIIGLTPCGRVTIAILRLNNPLAVIVRRNWVKAGWHPPKG